MICATMFFNLYFIADFKEIEFKDAGINHKIVIKDAPLNRYYTQSNDKYSVTYRVICEDEGEFRPFNK